VTVYPEDYTFREQVSMFANAEAILGPHGGGLANIIFCKPQVCVLELFSAKYVNPCYSRIAYRLDMDYCYATDDVPAHANYRAGTPYTEEDLSVRPEKVREWLQRL
jgi:capsular polysaccharide biosynthesis protein